MILKRNRSWTGEMSSKLEIKLVIDRIFKFFPNSLELKNISDQRSIAETE